VDITTATNYKFHVTKPGAEEEVIWAPEIDGTTKFKYTTVETEGVPDQNVVGWYKIQISLELGTWKGRAWTVEYEVFAHGK